MLEGDVLLVQPGSSLHFPAIECLRDAVCSRALAGTVLPGPPACPGDPAVTQCPPESLLVGVASGAQTCRLRVQGATTQLPCGGDQPLAAAALPEAVSPLPATALALRAVFPGLVISGLVRDMTVCSSSRSISTTLRHPGLLPHQQHRLHGGGGAGRAAAGAAQARPLAGLLQPAGTWDAASAGPAPGPAASAQARRQLCSPGEGLCRRAQPSCLPRAVCAGRWLLPRGCCCLSSGSTFIISSAFISKRWRLQHL